MSTNETQYLQELFSELDALTLKLNQHSPSEPISQDTLQLVWQAIQKEKELREKYHIGTRFNVILSQLKALHEKMQDKLNILQNRSDKAAAAASLAEESLAKHEMLVYVHLFNVHGKTLRTWQQLLSSKALFEHSVNRPIYEKEEQIEKILRRKVDQNQQAYLVVAIQKTDVMPDKSDKTPQDPPIIKLKQGALLAPNIKMFVHNSKKYRLNKDGILVPLI
jgi:hypothetical protein